MPTTPSLFESRVPPPLRAVAEVPGGRLLVLDAEGLVTLAQPEGAAPAGRPFAELFGEDAERVRATLARARAGAAVRFDAGAPGHGRCSWCAWPADEATLVVVGVGDVAEESGEAPGTDREDPLAGFVGTSPPMLRVRSLIQRAARSDVPVLILGETGVGKEMVARALHFAGPRRQRPFVDVNCAALTETLLESELFGHEKGAFTGAAARRRGQFELAHRGTLFLDEIGDMPPVMQAKVLRVLQEKRFARVGGEEAIFADVRVVAASNRDLRVAVREGRFREDLLYRINTLVIEVPPLRDRADDIPALVRHFLARTAGSPTTFSTAAIEALRRCAWPGNVRQLKHAVEHAQLMTDGPEIGVEHLPEDVLKGPPRPDAPPASLPEAVDHMERRMIEEALRRAGGVKARAARGLGITKRAILYKIRKFGLDTR